MYLYIEDRNDLLKAIKDTKQFNDLDPNILSTLKEVTLVMETRGNSHDLFNLSINVKLKPKYFKDLDLDVLGENTINHKNYSVVDVIDQPNEGNSDIFDDPDIELELGANIGTNQNIAATVEAGSSMDSQTNALVGTINDIESDLGWMGFYQINWFTYQFSQLYSGKTDIFNTIANIYNLVRSKPYYKYITFEWQCTLKGDEDKLITNYFYTSSFLCRDLFTVCEYNLSTKKYLLPAVVSALVYDYVTVTCKALNGEDDYRSLLYELVAEGVWTNLEQVHEILNPI